VSTLLLEEENEPCSLAPYSRVGSQPDSFKDKDPLNPSWYLKSRGSSLADVPNHPEAIRTDGVNPLYHPSLKWNCHFSPARREIYRRTRKIWGAWLEVAGQIKAFRVHQPRDFPSSAIVVACIYRMLFGVQSLYSYNSNFLPVNIVLACKPCAWKTISLEVQQN
jgi:hypothetical protein